MARNRLFVLTAMFSLIGIVVGGAVLVLVITSGGDSSAKEDALREMTLQPADLPQDFVLREERFYTRDEFLKQLPAVAHLSERGLRYALHRTYVTEGASPQQVDVLVYVYEDADGATKGQEYLRNDDGLYSILRRLDSGRQLRDFEGTTGGDPDFGDDSWTAHIKSNPSSESPQETSIFGMRYANLRAEIAVTIQPSVLLQPKDLARSQLQRIQRGSLSARS